MKYLFLLLLFAAALASAQSVPNGGLAPNQIWTATQWINAWQSKQDFSGSSTLTLGATYGVSPISLTVTGASGTGSIATVAFSTASAPPVGATVVISGISPSGYNGAVVVTASTSTSVSYSSSTTASYISGGSLIYAVIPSRTTSNIACPATGDTPVTLPIVIVDGTLLKISNPSSGACTLYTQNGQALTGMGATGTSGVIPAYTNVDVWTITNNGVLQYSVK